jgi:hypothetical protein
VLDPDSTDPVREVGNIQPPNGANEDAIQEQISRGSRDRSNIGDTVADIETDVANITRTTDSSGGISTILLQYLGDVKISGPTNGQVLEYNTAAGRWANVTPSSGTDNSLSEQNQTIAQGVTRDIVLDGSVSNNTYFRITDGSSNLIFSIQNYGTVLNIIEYYGLIAYRSTATAQGSIALYEPAASGTNFIRLQAPALGSDITLTLPNSTGASGQVLTTNGSGSLTWETPSAGGAAVLPLANISGRWMWSSADDGERVLTGNTAYGPFNFYSHTSEPSSSTIRIYSAGHVIGTTTGTMPAYYITAFGVHVPTTDKKIRVEYSFRVQNAPNGSTWGMSLWGVATPATGSSANQTFTLRGVSSSDTATTSSTVFYTGTFTTTSAINGGYVLPMMENRSGSLTSTTYMYGQMQINLVDS